MSSNSIIVVCMLKVFVSVFLKLLSVGLQILSYLQCRECINGLGQCLSQTPHTYSIPCINYFAYKISNNNLKVDNYLC